jgi:hypothetical protein
MCDQDGRYLIEYQAININPPQSLFQCSCGVCNDLYHLFHKHVIRCELSIPCIDEVFEDNCYDGIELYIDLVETRQRREEVLDRSWSGALIRGMTVLGREDTANQG